MGTDLAAYPHRWWLLRKKNRLRGFIVREKSGLRGFFQEQCHVISKTIVHFVCSLTNLQLESQWQGILAHTLCTFPGHRDVLMDLCGGFFVGFSLLVFFFFFFFLGGGGGGGGGGYFFLILFYFPFFVGVIVTLPYASRFIVTCIFSATLLRVLVFSLKISSLVVLGVSLFSHCCSTWSWVSSSWWHGSILHVLSGYLFL